MLSLPRADLLTRHRGQLGSDINGGVLSYCVGGLASHGNSSLTTVTVVEFCTQLLWFRICWRDVGVVYPTRLSDNRGRGILSFRVNL